MRKEAEYLREVPELVPRLDRGFHEYVHRNSPAVPLLGYFALSGVAKYFEPVRHDTLATIDNLMGAIESSTMHWNTHDIDKRLGELAVEALEIQRHLLEGEI